MIISDNNSDLYNISPDSKIFDYPLRMINSETLGKGFNLFINLLDDDAVLGDEERVWERMIELGANCIQTGWPNFLYKFREKKF